MRRYGWTVGVAMLLLAPACGDTTMGDGSVPEDLAMTDDAAGDAGGDANPGDLPPVTGDMPPTTGDMPPGDMLPDLGPTVGITAISPTAASRAVTTTETITGFGFKTGATITLTSCFMVGGQTITINAGTATVAGGGTSATFSLPADMTRPQGLYSVTIKNPDGTTATLSCALTISALAPPTVTKVQPGSAYQGKKGDNILSDQPITITGTGFLPTPAVELRSKATGQVWEATSVNWVSATSLTALVPSESQAMPVGDYDLTVVNPNLLAGSWNMPFKVTAVPPPIITSITPSNAASASCPLAITLTGSGFQMGMTVGFLVPPGTGCPGGSQAFTDVQGNSGCSGTVTSVTNGGATATITPPCTGLGLYPVEVTNPDQQYGIFQSFQFTSSAGGHFGAGTIWELGPNPNDTNSRWPLMTTPRWRHGFQFGFDVFGGTRLFAAGGQATATGAPLASVEAAQVDVFGAPGRWGVLEQWRSASQPRVPNTLGGLSAPQGRTGLELLRVGRFLYAIGGANVNTNDQTVYGAVQNAGDKGVLRTVERAEILGYNTMPLLQKPSWTQGTGLPVGTWYYRVSAVGAGGESLASAAVTATGGQGVIHLKWAAPQGGAPTSYNVYRSLAADGRANSERLLASGVMGTTFDDTGTGLLTPAPGRLQGSVTTGGTLVNATYSYRVSACVGGTCNDNDRSTETLAGYATDIVIDGTAGRSVLLTWNPTPNSKYRVFKRNPNTNRYEQIAKDVTDAQKPWKDDGTLTFPQTPILPKEGIAPLPIGSLSAWTTLSQNMVQPREGLDGVVLQLATMGKAALYVGGGRSTTAPNMPYLKTFERAIVDVATGDLMPWKEQTGHPLTKSRAFFSLLTTQDRDVTPVPPPPEEPPCPDFDGDGYQACYCYKGNTMACGTLSCDCNDNNPNIHPCANDICGNMIAENCVADMPCNQMCQTPDVDKDTHRQYQCAGDDCCDIGNEGTTWQGGLGTGKPGTLGCAAGTAAQIFPGAIEICGNGIDENCDGKDETCMMMCTDDMDKDGFIACKCFPNGPPETVTCVVNGVTTKIGKCDCNDADPKTFPCAEDTAPCDGVAQNCIADVCIIGREVPGVTSGPLMSTLPRDLFASAIGGGYGGRVGSQGMNALTMNPTEWLVAVGGGELMGAQVNGQTNGSSQDTIEACAVDLTTADLVRCDAAENTNAAWAVQGPGTQKPNVGLDGVLYAAGEAPFLLTWPGAGSESLGGAPTISTGTASRFNVDATTNNMGTMLADPKNVVTNYQSNSSKFVLDRAYYRMVRAVSYVYVLGGWSGTGPTATVERHQQ